MKTADVLARAVATLKASPSIDHWQRDREEIEADDLLCYALGVVEVDPDDDVPAPVVRRFHRMVERRATGEPVQLIKGFAVFRGLEVLARPGVFVPRDSTEFLAEQAIRRLRRSGIVVVDLACGGGTVGLAITAEVPGSHVYGTDISPTRSRWPASTPGARARQRTVPDRRPVRRAPPTLAWNRRHDRAAPSIRREARASRAPQ